MNEFVERCRREWRRLRVPKATADEMAAELQADLDEAAGEDVTIEELVGSDPRAFAAAWATARGVGRPRRLATALVFAAFAVFVAIAIAGAGIALFSAATKTAKPTGFVTLAVPSPSRNAVWVSSSTSYAPLPVTTSRNETHTIGLVLLLVGFAGAAVATLFFMRERVQPFRGRAASR